MKQDHCLRAFTKTTLKWTKDLNVTPETMKVLEENIGEKLLHIGLCNNFLYRTPEAQAIKQKSTSETLT